MSTGNAASGLKHVQNKQNDVGDPGEVLTLVLHALNALFLSEHLSKATSPYKHLSSTPKRVLALQKNELLNG